MVWEWLRLLDDLFMKNKWPGEWCSRCNRRNTVGFTVSDELWNKVVGNNNVVRCLTCFDEEAQSKNIEYGGRDIVALYPVSWSDWGKE